RLDLYFLADTCFCSSTHFFSFFIDPPTTEIYTLSLHDALPIYDQREVGRWQSVGDLPHLGREQEERREEQQIRERLHHQVGEVRSEEHTSELQSRENLVCRLLLEKKKKKKKTKREGTRRPRTGQ